MHDVKDVYFNWLIGKIKGVYYEELLWTMYDTDFKAPDESLDHNRVVDGLRLRDEFKAETRGNFKVKTGPCSFLEMLIALARRLEFDVMQESKYGDRTVDWFWMFIENMGMSQATNEMWNLTWERYVSRRLGKIQRKTYTRNGTGGLFVVNEHPDEDLRQIDIWWQLMWWVDENLRNGVID